MKTVLVVGDSLSMVRPGDGVCLEHTYPYMLQEKLGGGVYMFNCSQRANDSSKIVSEGYFSESVGAARVDFLILQLGIVDCTPRLFTDTQRKILAGLRLLPLLRASVDAVIKRKSLRRYDLTKRKRIVNVSLSEFESNIARFLEAAKAKSPQVKIVAVNIPYPGQSMVSRNFGLIENVENYNRCLAGVVVRYSGCVVDLFEYTRACPDSVLGDGHHIGYAAHRFISGKILQAIDLEGVV
jgi:hypothetical protein